MEFEARSVVWTGLTKVTCGDGARGRVTVKTRRWISTAAERSRHLPLTLSFLQDVHFQNGVLGEHVHE